MLPEKYRLKKNSALIATYKQKNSAADSFMCIYSGKEKKDSNIPTKFAFVVSKKVHKRAVVRNRIKRLMRESVRLMIKNNNTDYFNRYVSIIFAAKPASVNASFNDINSSVLNIIKTR